LKLCKNIFSKTLILFDIMSVLRSVNHPVYIGTSYYQILGVLIKECHVETETTIFFFYQMRTFLLNC